MLAAIERCWRPRRARSSWSVRPAPCGPGSGRGCQRVCSSGRLTRPAARARLVSGAFMPYQAASSTHSADLGPSQFCTPCSRSQPGPAAASGPACPATARAWARCSGTRQVLPAGVEHAGRASLGAGDEPGREVADVDQGRGDVRRAGDEYRAGRVGGTSEPPRPVPRPPGPVVRPADSDPPGRSAPGPRQTQPSPAPTRRRRKHRQLASLSTTMDDIDARINQLFERTPQPQTRLTPAQVRETSPHRTARRVGHMGMT